MAELIFLHVIFWVSAAAIKNTGIAPEFIILNAEARNTRHITIISSPTHIFNKNNAKSEVLLLTATVNELSVELANIFRNCDTHYLSTKNFYLRIKHQKFIDYFWSERKTYKKFDMNLK